MTCEICVHASEYGSWPQWLLNKGGTHCHGCHRTWTAKREVHCVGLRANGTVCHLQFSADSAANKHRQRGVCLTPDEIAGKRGKTGDPVLRSTLTSSGDVLWRHHETLTVKPAYLVRT